jgi:hypothetical protein
MKAVLITLTNVGANVCSAFNIYSDADNYVSAFEVNIPLASLVAGFTSYNAPDNTTIVRLVPIGCACSDPLDLALPTTTTTSTSSSSTTTTTTTPYPGPWYYYDVTCYKCVDCTPVGFVSRIANRSNDLDAYIDHFYYQESIPGTWYVFEILGISADQTSPAWYTDFTGAGTINCSVC